MIYLILYNLGFLLVLLPGVPFLLFRMAFTRRFREGLGERLGFYRNLPAVGGGRGSIWIQAASVGEVTAALPLIGLLREEFPHSPVVLTCQTAAGRRVAREKTSAPAVLSPLDLGPIVSRLIRRISPRILILIETEIWPGTIMTARRRGIPVVVVNGRISSRSFPHYRRVKILLRPLLQGLSGLGMRSSVDAERIRALGAPTARIWITGDIKFDSPSGPGPAPAGETGWRRRWGWPPEHPVIVAGSTFEGEEILLYAAFCRLKDRFPGLRLILAPRHLERVGSLEAFFHSRDVQPRLFSRLSPADAETELVILDRMGVLSRLYREATVVFVGRSLRGTGGQNPIEPAAAGKPILFGPHMENFSEIAEELLVSGGAVRVEDESRLAELFGGLLADPEKRAQMSARAREVVAKQRGASRRNLEMIRKIIL